MAYRVTPHAITGFSPYTLVQGREMRSLLKVLHGSWVENEVQFSSSIEWINEFKYVCNGKRKRADIKVKIDKKAVERRFKVGQMVLVHTPELVGKLDSIWEGDVMRLPKLSAQPLTNY